MGQREILAKITTGQADVKSAYLNYGKHANLWIWLGDNAYETGTIAEYNSNVFAQYSDIFKNTPVYPAPGNHDYANVGYQSVSALGTSFPYFNFFYCSHRHRREVSLQIPKILFLQFWQHPFYFAR